MGCQDEKIDETRIICRFGAWMMVASIYMGDQEGSDVVDGKWKSRVFWAMLGLRCLLNTQFYNKFVGTPCMSEARKES